MSAKSQRMIAAILLGGIVAATIDIGAACLISGRSIPFILQTIAGGILGKQSFSGGGGTAVLGLFLQEAMGLIISAIYVAASQRLAALARRWIVFGLVYGVVIFFVMNYVVVPLSAWKHWPVFSVQWLLANMAAMLLFGLIVAYFAARRTGVRLDGSQQKAHL